MITVVRFIFWVHVSMAVSGFVLSGVLAVWILRQADITHLSRNFWIWQRTVQWMTVVLGLAGTSLYLMGNRPKDPLHILYGALALLATLLLAGFGPDRDPRELLSGWSVNPKWILFGLEVFLWAMYGRGLTTGFAFRSMTAPKVTFHRRANSRESDGTTMQIAA